MSGIVLPSPTNFLAHRSGWFYVTNRLQKLNDTKKGSVICDDFIDITFGYNHSSNKLNGTIPYTKPWIGFIHHPPKICPWYTNKNLIDIHKILNTEEFLSSLKHCKALFVLSNYLNNYLKNNFAQLKDIPIYTVYHPTSFDCLSWDFTKFKTFYKSSGTKIISVGYFLRNLSSIFLLNATKKLDRFLMPSHLQLGMENLKKELLHKKLEVNNNNTKILNWQNHFFYDKMLEQSVMFQDLYDTSCNNAIIEAVVRDTPIIVNRHPAITEYIGKDYPGFYKNLSDIRELLNYDNISACNEYLKNKDKTIFNIEYFVDNFLLNLKDCGIYNNHRKKKTFISTTQFNHRHGWHKVVDSISKIKFKTPIKILDFVDHSFQQTELNKKALINGQKIILSKGYNYFKYKNNDICINNDQIYSWETNRWKSKQYTLSDIENINQKKYISFKTENWLGFMHNPVEMPLWFDYSQNIHSLLKEEAFIDSLKKCKGLLVFSKNNAESLKKLFKKSGIDVPVLSCYHPIPLQKNKWDYDLFLETKNFIQVGYWLRNMSSFWEIKTNLIKTWLYGDIFAIDMLKQEGRINAIEKRFIVNKLLKTKNCLVDGVYLANVNNNVYDKFMRSSVMYANYYNVSASNTILECMAYATPLLTNRLPAIEEYLGSKYPLYIENTRHASKLLKDNNRILAAHEYLLDKQLLKKISMKNFTSTFKIKVDELCKR